jgi:hypothetical protein
MTLQVVLAAELLLAACARVWLEPCNMFIHTSHSCAVWCISGGEEEIGNHAHPCVCTCGEPGCPCQDSVPHILGRSMCHPPNGSHVGVAPDSTLV